MTTSTLDNRMAFRVEQRDPGVLLPRQLILRYYYEDGSVDLMEQATGRFFLKRTHTDTPVGAFSVGATIILFGKPTTITAYADEVTRQLCEHENQSTTILIVEDSFPSLGRYLSMLVEECCFTVTAAEMVWLRTETMEPFDLPEELKGSRVVVVTCTRADAVEKGFDFIERATGTCTAKDATQAHLWAKLVPLAKTSPLAIFDDVTTSVVVLKPALVSSGRGGSVIQQLLDNGLEPSALTTLAMTSGAAQEFLAPYRSVLLNHEATIKSFVGTVWVLQVVSLVNSMNVVDVVRATCGPYDTVVAKKLFPKSIRALYGKDEANNAVHCCDLPTDGPFYAKFFFKR